MMPEPKTSAQWTAGSVVSRLKQKLSGGHPVSVQVFLVDKGGDLSARALEIVEQSQVQAGLSGDSAEVGKVFRLANSFSVSSNKLKFFETLGIRPEVKSLIESEQPDIFPRPVLR
jgi:hypothetical protein